MAWEDTEYLTLSELLYIKDKLFEFLENEKQANEKATEKYKK
jgi:hypothetical protein